MRRTAPLVASALAMVVGACAHRPPAPDPLPDAIVTAKGETNPVGTSAADAADDPAIWRNPDEPAASLIVATDKKAGLYVYGLDGKVRDFQPDGRLNNVDLITAPDGSVLAVQSPTPQGVDLLLWKRGGERASKVLSVTDKSEVSVAGRYCWVWNTGNLEGNQPIFRIRTDTGRANEAAE